MHGLKECTLLLHLPCLAYVVESLQYDIIWIMLLYNLNKYLHVR